MQNDNVACLPLVIYLCVLKWVEIKEVWKRPPLHPGIDWCQPEASRCLVGPPSCFWTRKSNTNPSIMAVNHQSEVGYWSKQLILCTAAEQVINNGLSTCFSLCVMSVEYLLPGCNSWLEQHAVFSAGQSQIGLGVMSSVLLLFLL